VKVPLGYEQASQHMIFRKEAGIPDVPGGSGARSATEPG
jgi:hypothetical protein